MYLLDASVLIALGDLGHEHEDIALRFFRDIAVPSGWATCPLTENAFLRILCQPHYPRPISSPEDARQILQRLLAAPGHQFWPDALSLMDKRVFPSLPAPKHHTDIYLLALAVKHHARFATFDSRINASLIPGGPHAYHLLTNS